MTRRTKKVAASGRFGTRYGARLRKRIREVDATAKITHRCPRCRLYAVKKESIGIWECRKCHYRYAGGAWSPITNSGRRIEGLAKQIQERRFEE